MRLAKTIGVALLAGSTALTFALPASSAPMLPAQAGLAKAGPSSTENVQYRRHYHGGHYYHGHRGGGGAGALIGGLAAGAIIGGAIAAGQANAAAAAQQNHQYCAQRYRSYDPRSGTYLNNDGNRYPCP